MAARTRKPASTPVKAGKRQTRSRAGGKPITANRNADKPEVRIFVSYSHADDGARDRLQTHLAALMRDGVSTWFDGDMNAGDALDAAVARALRHSHIFVALLSPDYIASRYCWNIEFRRAMSRRARATMRVVAAIVKPCDWKATRAARFKLLPRDGRPVTRWRSADDAFLDIAEGIRGVVKALRSEMVATAAKRPRKASPTTKAAGKSSAPRVAGGTNAATTGPRPRRTKRKK